MSYLDIESLYKNQEILLFRECFALEKIHGTSAHIRWNGEKISYFSGGETHEKFIALFNTPELIRIFKEIIGNALCIIYGEAHGGKQQGMSHIYGKEIKFVVFDVKIGDLWLDVPKAESVTKQLGLEFVHYAKITTDLQAIDAERDADSIQAIRNGVGSGKMREGVVLRPLIELRKNNGDRIIAKHKRTEFAERKHEPRVVDPTKFEILRESEAIADEWVVPMRLEHILQKLPHAIGMEQTADVIRAMIADVYKEAAGEIIESKEVARAIGKKTAKMWQDRISKELYGKGKHHEP